MTAKPEKILIDCDPGQDDAVALFLALADVTQLEVLGITTVAGNVPLSLTARNARIICDLAGQTSLPVYAGCRRPLARELVTAEAVHGKTGIDGVELFEPNTPLLPEHAVQYLVSTLGAAEPSSVTLVATGPLTNVATALVQAPQIATSLKRIVLMGGAMREAGNITPSAEFNFYVDPHAAEIVLGCGRPIVVFGLDVTHQVVATPERTQRIRGLANPVAVATANMLEFYARFNVAIQRAAGAPLHDPCTIAYLLDEALFAGRECYIRVETESALTRGHSAVDYWGVTAEAPNAVWIDRADDEGFYQLLTAALARYAAG